MSGGYGPHPPPPPPAVLVAGSIMLAVVTQEPAEAEDVGMNPCVLTSMAKHTIQCVCVCV